MRHSGTISELWRYPVKSMAGEPVEALRVDWRGAGGDRTHALHFEHKGALKQLTIREAPGMVHWRAGYGADTDVDPAHPPRAQLTAPAGRQLMWDDPALPGVLAADLGRAVTLRRDVEGQQDLGRSLLVTTEATRLALEEEMGAPIDLRRFRTNVHLDLDAPAWAEAGWEGRSLELEGGVVLRFLHPCVRCVIPTRHPDTAQKWPELLKHLSRAHDTGFGVNARVEVPGTLRIGYSAWTSERTSETDALASPNSSAVFSS